ncbi:MAG TPA: hypothetical protein VFB38_13195 [Chthonomonadaceae bacterium]|nr:hypothetical protein [Chthonomonadaceae bacterium]
MSSPQRSSSEPQNVSSEPSETGRSITEALLPQTLAGVFDEAFDLYKRHFSTLALTAALLYLPAHIVLNGLLYLWLRPLQTELAAQRGSADFDVFFQVGLVFLLFSLVVMAALILTTGPVAVAVSDLYLGRRVSVREAYRRARPHLLRLFGGWLVVALAFIGISFVSFFVITVLLALILSALGLRGTNSGLTEEIGVVVGLLMVLCPYFVGCMVLARNYLFTTQLIVLEGLGVSQVSPRNTQLVGKARFWRSFWAVFFLPILSFGLISMISYSARSALSLVPLPPLADFLATTAVSVAASFFIQPYWMIFLTLLYYDYRVRREGLDLRILSANLPQPEQAAAPAFTSNAPAAGYGMPQAYPSPYPSFQHNGGLQPTVSMRPQPTTAPLPEERAAFDQPADGAAGGLESPSAPEGESPREEAP